MPTYDYHCQSCGHDFTVLHKISDPAPECPQCHGEARKKLCAPAVLSKGSGKPAPAPVTCGMGGRCPHAH
jgi:putative FmdB family regulatory protein